MAAAAELGRNPVIKHQIQPEYGDEQADAGRDCRIISRDQFLRRERGQEIINFPCSADHVQDDWQCYPVDPYSCYMCDHTYIPMGRGKKPCTVVIVYRNGAATLCCFRKEKYFHPRAIFLCVHTFVCGFVWSTKLRISRGALNSFLAFFFTKLRISSRSV